MSRRPESNSYPIQYWIFLLLIISCKNKTTEVKSDSSQTSKYLFKLSKSHPDTVKLDTVQRNSIHFYSRLDSIVKKERYKPENSTHNTYLFVYHFDNKKDIPTKIDNYDESKSKIFLPSNEQSIIYEYSFDKLGMNYISLIYLESFYFRRDSNDSIQEIEFSGIFQDSVYVTQ